jgi:hypothetical protein
MVRRRTRDAAGRGARNEALGGGGARGIAARTYACNHGSTEGIMGLGRGGGLTLTLHVCTQWWEVQRYWGGRACGSACVPPPPNQCPASCAPRHTFITPAVRRLGARRRGGPSGRRSPRPRPRPRRRRPGRPPPLPLQDALPPPAVHKHTAGLRGRVDGPLCLLRSSENTAPQGKRGTAGKGCERVCRRTPGTSNTLQHNPPPGHAAVLGPAAAVAAVLSDAVHGRSWGTPPAWQLPARQPGPRRHG